MKIIAALIVLAVGLSVFLVMNPDIRVSALTGSATDDAAADCTDGCEAERKAVVRRDTAPTAETSAPQRASIAEQLGR